MLAVQFPACCRLASEKTNLLYSNSLRGRFQPVFFTRGDVSDRSSRNFTPSWYILAFQAGKIHHQMV
jgi:hypothetical protein